MNRKNYSTKVIAVFEIMGAFFIDTYYNDLYLKARDDVQSGRQDSITEAYRRNVINYMRGVASRKDLYVRVVKDLHKYYQQNSGFVAIIFSEFEDKFLSQFIPAEYYKDFNENNKDSVLREIIVQTVNDLGVTIVSKPYLGKIIDDHKNTLNIDILQNKIMDIFVTIREEYYSKFAQEVNKNSVASTVSKDLLERLKVAFVEEKKKRIEAERDRDRAIGMIQQLVKRIPREALMPKTQQSSSQHSSSTRTLNGQTNEYATQQLQAKREQQQLQQQQQQQQREHQLTQQQQIVQAQREQQLVQAQREQEHEMSLDLYQRPADNIKNDSNNDYEDIFGVSESTMQAPVATYTPKHVEGPLMLTSRTITSNNKMIGLDDTDNDTDGNNDDGADDTDSDDGLINNIKNNFAMNNNTHGNHGTNGDGAGDSDSDSGDASDTEDVSPLVSSTVGKNKSAFEMSGLDDDTW